MIMNPILEIGGIMMTKGADIMMMRESAVLELQTGAEGKAI